MGKTKYKYKNRGGADNFADTDAVRSVRINVLPQSSFSNTFHMLGMIMPLLTSMTLFIILLVNAKWIAFGMYSIGLIIIYAIFAIGFFKELSFGEFRDNPIGFPHGLNFGAGVYNFMFLLMSLFPAFGGIKPPTTDSPEFWTTFLIITAFMIMDMVHKMGFRKTKGLITSNLDKKKGGLLAIAIIVIPSLIALAMSFAGAGLAEEQNDRELFYLQESYSDKKCSPCDQKKAINDARDEIITAINS